MGKIKTVAYDTVLLSFILLLTFCVMFVYTIALRNMLNWFIVPMFNNDGSLNSQQAFGFLIFFSFFISPMFKSFGEKYRGKGEGSGKMVTFLIVYYLVIYFIGWAFQAYFM